MTKVWIYTVAASKDEILSNVVDEFFLKRIQFSC